MRLETRPAALACPDDVEGTPPLPQNVHLTSACTVRGGAKCVPENVERKLYSATLFVRLNTNVVQRRNPRRRR